MQVASRLNSAVLDSALAKSGLSLACAVLVALSALVKFPIPGSPVPATLQTFALLFCAGMLGRWYALQMVGWYLALGAIGAPFFAGVSLFGATGGYLVGFVAASAIVGFASSRCDGFVKRCAVYALALPAIYVPGLLWLKLAMSSSWQATLAMGMWPFIAADLLKAGAASLAVHIGRK